MKILQLSILATILGFSTSSFAADWTNYLKSMQDSCKIASIEKSINKKSDIPKNLHSSISKYSVKNNMFDAKDADIRLKNATAFGQPISRITHTISSEGRELTVYFKNNHFINLKPKFSINFDGKNHAVGSKKAWLIYSESEDGTPQKIMNVPYQGENGEYFNNQEDWNMVLTIDDMGWSYGGTEYGSYDFLEFNKQQKTITCGSRH